MTSFEDPWNPTSTEIRQWAFEADAMHPCQDWELALLWTGFEDLFLELAADRRCPSKDFFLSMLYLMVGDYVRRGVDHQVQFNLKDFIGKADGLDSDALRTWQRRSLDLLRHPEKFDYEEWCAGRLAATP
jgi:hypothetical protein